MKNENNNTKKIVMSEETQQRTDQEVVKRRRGEIEVAKYLEFEKCKLRPGTADGDSRQSKGGNSGCNGRLRGQRP